MFRSANVYWDDVTALARLLKESHPDVPINEISIGMVNKWVLELPQFRDDPELVNDDILLAILSEWIEEAS
ncbi:MAG: Fe-S cluster assembly protein IscX [Anaerolineales bacterium]